MNENDDLVGDLDPEKTLPPLVSDDAPGKGDDNPFPPPNTGKPGLQGDLA